MKICVGISGSIAAYRSVDFVKELKKQGHEVICILTRGGQEFVSKRALETFSGNPVLSSNVFEDDHFSTDHIQTARWADLFVVYGASAHFLARAALGFGDDFLTLQLLAFEGRKVFAPAMNPSMWRNPALQKNVSSLIEQGWTLAAPIAGQVACGENGIGHIASFEDIFQKMFPENLSSLLPALQGKRILISAGPMRTSVDTVRFLQNRSSGRMGLEIARACREAGAKDVKILLGPVDREIKQSFVDQFSVSSFESATDYEKHLDHLFPKSDVFFSVAAVLDFELQSHDKKMERSLFQKNRELKIPLNPVEDIVAKFNRKKTAGQMVIAFAAESGNEREIIDRATAKMLKKGVDALVANPVWEGLGPESERNQFWILRPRQEPKVLGPDLKSKLARPLLNELF